MSSTLQNHQILSLLEAAPEYFLEVNPAAAGPPRHPLRGRDICIVASLYFCDDIIATQKDKETKLRTHLSEYLAEVVSKSIPFEMTPQCRHKSNYRFTALSYLTIYPIYEAQYKGPIIGQEQGGSVLRCFMTTAGAV